MALTDTPTRGERYNTKEDLLAMQMPIDGVAVDASGRAKNPKQQTLLDQQEEEETGEGQEERKWYEPLDQFPAYGAGLLAAGASMMRQSGWRDVPITRDEMIGHAIPAGMEAYYNQKIMNRQEDADIAEAQNVQRTAEDEEEDELLPTFRTALRQDGAFI